ncbi:collectrin [Catharus ustulatus]|uniref:Collectrin-like domain-containing protein n=2 Tax=Catharus TaxID=9184 RepID=A0A8C3TKZ3_CATUS|nr:collectrin [Catharus ustulatus]NXQ41238.1 TMM27 protein [Catharus fuscescens]
MLRALLLTLSVVAIAHAELCKPDAQNAFKVRISIKTALGDNAYVWDANEEYLFKAMVAFAMRRYSSKSTTQISNVLLCNVTDRVSFWFVVTDSSKNVTTVPGSEVEAAIRMNRNRINNAFLLSDKTLQFVKITTTLSPPVESSTPVWLIVFGVVLCLIVAGIVFLIISGIRKHKKKNKESTERENLEEKVEVTLENGIPCEALDIKAGHVNGVFAADDERFTSL